MAICSIYFNKDFDLMQTFYFVFIKYIFLLVIVFQINFSSSCSSKSPYAFSGNGRSLFSFPYPISSRFAVLRKLVYLNHGFSFLKTYLCYLLLPSLLGTSFPASLPPLLFLLILFSSFSFHARAILTSVCLFSLILPLV